MEADKRCMGVSIRGAGQVAREHCRAIERNPHLYLAAVCSRNPESGRRLRDQFNPQAKVYDHYEGMLSYSGVDIVSICIPNYLHAGEAIQALDAEKHLILEKPPAINMEELQDLRSAALRATTRSVVSFVLRWHPMVKNLKAILE